MAGFVTTPLVIPPLWNHDWATLVEEASGTERELIRTQQFLVQSLSRMRDITSAPESLAWLTLWTRAFNICDSARETVERTVIFSLHLVNRALFELRLHLVTILGVRGRSTSVDGPSSSKDDVVDRLRAYAALCLWEDAEHHSSFLDSKTFNEIYDPQPTRELIRSLGPHRAAWEAMMGPIEELSDQEISFDQHHAKNQSEGRMQWLLECLADSRIEPWSAKVKQLGQPVSFFALINQNEKSVRKRLRALGTEFAYLEYARSSRIIHGSTIEHLTAAPGPAFVPLVGDAAKEFDRLLEQVTWEARGAVVLLSLMQDKVFGPLPPSLG